jgi:hypothetical protein
MLGLKYESISGGQSKTVTDLIFIGGESKEIMADTGFPSRRPRPWIVKKFCLWN